MLIVVFLLARFLVSGRPQGSPLQRANCAISRFLVFSFPASGWERRLVGSTDLVCRDISRGLPFGKSPLSSLQEVTLCYTNP